MYIRINQNAIKARILDVSDGAKKTPYSAPSMQNRAKALWKASYGKEDNSISLVERQEKRATFEGWNSTLKNLLRKLADDGTLKFPLIVVHNRIENFITYMKNIQQWISTYWGGCRSDYPARDRLKKRRERSAATTSRGVCIFPFFIALLSNPQIVGGNHA